MHRRGSSNHSLGLARPVSNTVIPSQGYARAGVMGARRGRGTVPARDVEKARSVESSTPHLTGRPQATSLTHYFAPTSMHPSFTIVRCSLATLPSSTSKASGRTRRETSMGEDIAYLPSSSAWRLSSVNPASLRRPVLHSIPAAKNTFHPPLSMRQINFEALRRQDPSMGIGDGHPGILLARRPLITSTISWRYADISDARGDEQYSPTPCARCGGVACVHCG